LEKEQRIPESAVSCFLQRLQLCTVSLVAFRIAGFQLSGDRV
jgi:hypothetical protein